jgi:hypothetical protein
MYGTCYFGDIMLASDEIIVSLYGEQYLRNRRIHIGIHLRKFSLYFYVRFLKRSLAAGAKMNGTVPYGIL